MATPSPNPSSSSHIDLTNARGERIGRLVRIGNRWQSFTVCPASDTLKYVGTFSAKADARDAVKAVAHRAP